ncbi:MAG: acetylxylan esterase, partial [Candidatus Omnitrophica bacterium]|nr:acetylxylan esterase [Candidatus Omnitrophota bacterium]
VAHTEMNTLENWGLFSPQAEAHLESVMGLQTYDSIRALDFLIGLPDIDPDRLAVTGASGGGTQTFILAAIDPRLAVAFPAVMVSTAMQGGCTCENASLLRVDTGNVEFAALFAPKPLGMTAADDWTKEMPTKGFPELKQHYQMLGAPDNVMLKALLHFGHNYNYVSRAAMYSWLNKQLKLGCKEPIVEEYYQRLTIPEMSVWDDQHPKPSGGPEFERGLLRWIADDSARQVTAARDSLDHYRELVGGAVEVLIGRNLAEAGEVEYARTAETDCGGYRACVGLLRNKLHREELPLIVLRPKQPTGQIVIWIDESGKAGLYSDVDSSCPKLKPGIQRLIDAGAAVIGVDLLYQGEFLKDGKSVTQTRRVNNPRESAAYTFGYNRALFAQQVDDILTVISFAKNQEPGLKTLDLIGLGAAGPWVAAARAQAPGAVDLAVVDTGGFRFGSVLDLRDVSFLPGGAKYDDLPGMLALGAPGKLWLAGEGKQVPEVVRRIYDLARASSNLTVFDGSPAEIHQAAINQLMDF